MLVAAIPHRTIKLAGKRLDEIKVGGVARFRANLIKKGQTPGRSGRRGHPDKRILYFSAGVEIYGDLTAAKKKAARFWRPSSLGLAGGVDGT